MVLFFLYGGRRGCGHRTTAAGRVFEKLTGNQPRDQKFCAQHF